MNIALFALHAAAALVAPAVPQAPGPGVETFEYTVVQGDTCSAIAKRHFGNAKRYDVIHRFNPKMGPTPHHLRAGEILILPRAGTVAPTGPDAEVTATRKRVEARPADEEGWRAAAIGLDLFRGWRVNTLARAWAELTFRDTSVLEVRENTLVIIYGPTEGSARRATAEASLDRGALRSRLGELAGGPKLHVETPSATTDLEGGRALVTVDDSGTSRVANHGGAKASVAGKRPAPKKRRPKPTVVTDGMGSKVETGKDPTPPKPLPPAPRFIATPANRFVAIPTAGATVVARWESEPKAAAYRVEVARRADGRDVVADGIAPRDVRRLELYGLPPGDYWITVASIDDDHFEGIPNTPLPVRVVEAKLVGPDYQPISLPALVDDAIAPPPPAVALGSTLVAPDGLRCSATGTEAADAPMRFASAGATSIVCRDDAGSLSAELVVDVAPWTVTLDGGRTQLDLTVGRAETLVFGLAAASWTARAIEIEGPDGVGVGAPEQLPDGRWSVAVTASKADVSPAELVVRLDNGTEIGRVALAIHTEGDAPAPVVPAQQKRWIDRWTPVRGMWELGAFAGVFVPSRGLELFEPRPARDDGGFSPLRRVGPTIGARLGYFPLRVLGAEIEASLSPSETTGGDRATMFAARGHVIGRLGFSSITPFVLAGVGLIGVDSNPSVVGRDVDAALHFGGGLEVFANQRLAVRIDVRDVVTADRGLDAGLTSSLEVTGGISVTLGRKRARHAPARRGGGEMIIDSSATEPPPTAIEPPPPAEPEPPARTPQDVAPRDIPPGDGDGDGIPDDVDGCLDEPETANGFEDTDGCPDALPPALADFTGTMEGIVFETGKDVIASSSRATLDRAADVLKKFPQIRVMISGHTDNVGSRPANIDLSSRRAIAVRRYLIDAGIAADRLETRGAGPDEPVDSNATKSGRQRNRRIEFELLRR